MKSKLVSDSPRVKNWFISFTNGWIKNDTLNLGRHVFCPVPFVQWATKLIRSPWFISLFSLNSDTLYYLEMLEIWNHGMVSVFHNHFMNDCSVTVKVWSFMRWTSLCMRLASYLLGDLPIVVPSGFQMVSESLWSSIDFYPSLNFLSWNLYTWLHPECPEMKFHTWTIPHGFK